MSYIKSTFITAVSVLAFAASLGASYAFADELKLAHFSSTKYHLHNEMFLPLAQKIAEATGDGTTIRVYPGGELGKGPVKQYDRVIDGVADIVQATPHRSSKKRCWWNCRALYLEMPTSRIKYGKTSIT